jgi:hypothetical protein
MANIGAYDPTQPTPFNQWYTTNAQGQTIITIPAEYGNGGIHTPGFVGQPSRPQPVAGNIQGQNLVQYDYTPQQYAALTKLIATFVSIFPAIPLSYPRNPTTGQLITVKLPDAQLAVYKGLLGHYHIQTDKIDPGPAFQWDLVVEGAKEIVLASQLRKARYHPPQEGKEANKAAPASLGAAAAASSPSAAKDQSASASSSSNNTLRRLERKLLQSAEDAAAREQLTSSMTLEDVEEQTLFYLVHAGWYAAMQAWLACEDDSVARPCAPTNHLLLSSDLRTPLSNLSLGRDYIPLGRPVWQELMDIYGGATPIVRKTADIYGIRAAGVSSPQQAASSSQLNGGASSPPSYASPASSSSPLIVPAVAPSSSSSSSSMPSVSLADGWMYVSKKLTGQ